MSEQGTEAWRLERCGKVTASRMADLCARTKSGYGASRANYMAELVIERLTGQPVEQYQNEAMRWGSEQEAAARSTYAFLQDATVEAVGFIAHPLIAEAGASPDGYVGDTGLVEIKAPNSATHVETLLTETIPDKYVKQMQFQMACTGRGWCDFVSFDPRMPPSMQVWIKRVWRDPKAIGEIEEEARLFLDELKRKVEALEKRYALKEAA